MAETRQQIAHLREQLAVAEDGATRSAALEGELAREQDQNQELKVQVSKLQTEIESLRSNAPGSPPQHAHKDDEPPVEVPAPAKQEVDAQSGAPAEALPAETTGETPAPAPAPAPTRRKSGGWFSRHKRK